MGQNGKAASISCRFWCVGVTTFLQFVRMRAGPVILCSFVLTGVCVQGVRSRVLSTGAKQPGTCGLRPQHHTHTREKPGSLVVPCL